MATSRFDQLITSVLRHPASLAMKGWVRDRWWAFHGPRLTNPAVPAAPQTLLFVCKGNICRSPFAERLTARLTRESGAPVRCVSAGFEASLDGRSPDAAQTAARAFGVTLDDHRAQPLTATLMAEADLVIVNEQAHVERLARQYPRQAGKVFLLPLAAPDAARGAGYRRFNIADPYGHPEPVFAECYTYIDQALRGLLGARAPRRP